ncbi:MAG: hypothetical protein A3K19_11870 [Lentisphaerae bacterium RIFOXYB12_FULL_65_16]|nr:MAG: hypothetical protein A3K18_27150 [Lentisphaerae bacterium RIFOXYA12_64_32]OGV87958.1 MAG: hypothetical protein A3K19_11870 [Lentisphaerae bacterium RIFOXYB12_FULL_65_16]
MDGAVRNTRCGSRRCVVASVLLPALPFLSLLLPLHFLVFRDVFPYVLPIRAAFADAAPGLALWDSFSQCGQSMSGNPIGVVYYPLFWVSTGFGFWGSVVFLVLTHYLLIGLAAYVFFRYGLRQNPLPSLFGATTLACSGYLYSMGDMFQFLSVPWLILCAAFWLRLAFYRKGHNAGLPLAGLILSASLAVLGAQLQEVLVCAMALGAVTVWSVLRIRPRLALRRRRFRAVATYALIAIPAILILCALPTWERVLDGLDGIRATGLPMQEIIDWSTPPDRLLDLVLPSRYGASRTGAYVGGRVHPYNLKSVPWSPSIYVGVAALLLVAGAPRRRFLWLRNAAWAGLILAVLMAMGKYTPFFGLTLKALPFLAAFQFPEKYLLFATFAVAVLAALSFDGLLAAGPRRASIALPSFLAAFWAVALGVALVAWQRLPADIANPLLARSVIVQTTVFVALTALYLVLLTRLARGGAAAWRLAAVACALNAADLLTANLRDPMVTRLSEDPLRAPHPLVGRIQADMTGQFDRSLFRVATRIEHEINRSGGGLERARLAALTGSGPALFGLRCTEGLYPNFSRRYHVLTQRLKRKTPMLFWQISASRYLIIEQCLVQGNPESAGFQVLARDENSDLVLLRNTAVLPRLGFFADWVVADGMEGALAALQETGAETRLATRLVLESPARARPAEGQDQSADFAIRELRERSGHLVADVVTPAPGVIYFAENWHRHWHASLDGSEAPILHANGLFLAVWVPTAGTHHVEFRFGW